MSLNGLDDAAIHEAHQSALAEAGGWFLLKYTSRDSVELLARGKGGVQEARAEIAKYEEKSPVYGLFMYRRRKVVIKHMPEGTSRVLLARTTVHFPEVLEKWSPYDTVLEISTSDGINENSLAASFPLHTASTSTWSGRLQEITEDAEDSPPGARPAARSNASNSSHVSQRLKSERRVEEIMRGRRSQSPRRSESPSSPPTSSQADGAVQAKAATPSPARKTHISQYLIRDDAGQTSITPLTSDAATVPKSQFASLGTSSSDNEAASTPPETAEEPASTSPALAKVPSPMSEDATPPPLSRVSSDRPLETREARRSSQVSDRASLKPSARAVSAERPSSKPSTRPVSAASSSAQPPTSSAQPKYDDDPYDFSRFEPKPKVRLGPRPVSKAKLPSVANIASVPASHRSSFIKKQELSNARNAPRPSTAPVPPQSSPQKDLLPTPPPIPSASDYNPRPVSGSSVKSVSTHRSTATTPDKLRLMKAIEMRKRQMRRSNPPMGAFVPPPDDAESPPVPVVPDDVEDGPSPSVEKDLPQPKVEDASEDVSQRSVDEDQPPQKDVEDVLEDVPQRNVEDTSEAVQEPGAEKDISQRDVADKFEDAPERSIEKDVQQEDAPEQSIEKDVQQQYVEKAPEVAVQPAVTRQEDALLQSAKADSGISMVYDKTRKIEEKKVEEARPVPTIVVPDGSRPISSEQQQPVADENSNNAGVDTEREDHESISSRDELEPPKRQVQKKRSDLRRRRRGIVEPTSHDLDTEISTDDELMDELQSAELQEAKPIMVSKSPVAAYFPRRPSAQSEISAASVKPVSINRTSTNPPDFSDLQDQLTPERPNDYYGHSQLRAASPSLQEPGDNGGSPRRVVSSGISKRIQALSQRSSVDASSPRSPVFPDFSQREFPSREVKRSPVLNGGSFPTNSHRDSYRALHRASVRMNPSHSRTSSNKSNSVPPAENNTTWSVQQDATATGSRNSVSVSARIVRADSSGPSEPGLPGAEPPLKTSPLLVSQHNEDEETPPKSSPFLPTTQRPATSASEIATAAIPASQPVRLRSPTDPSRAMHSASKFGRHKAAPSTGGLSVEDFPVPPRTDSQASADDNNIQDKEGSKTSRFFKRMSNIGAGGNKLGKRTPQSSVSTIERPPSKAPPAVVVGDLNIQFPDSLLWKRRIVSLDDTGHLLFALSSQQKGAITKKYPLTDFRAPFVPDLDRQELPHSLMLDFVADAAGTLQIACEDGASHRHVVGVLKTYWKAWSGVTAA